MQKSIKTIATRGLDRATTRAFYSICDKRFNLIYKDQHELVVDTASQQLVNLNNVDVDALVAAIETYDCLYHEMLNS